MITLLAVFDWLVVFDWLLKLACVVVMFLLAILIHGIYKTMEKFPKDDVDRGWIAWGIVAEFLLLIALVLYVVTG